MTSRWGVRRFLIVCMVLALCSCYREAYLTVNNDGTGKGTLVYFEEVNESQKEQIREKLQENQLTIVKERQIDSARYAVDFTWSDFNASFDKRIVESDGTIMLSFFDTDLDVVEVTVPGRVVPERTTGFVFNESTVFFAAGNVTLAYRR